MTTLEGVDAGDRSRHRAPWLAAGLTAALTAGLVLAGDRPLGDHPAFLPAWLTLVLACDVLTVALLVDRYRAGGGPRLLALSWAYVWSAALIVGTGVALPGIVTDAGGWSGDHNVVWTLWTARHLGLPLFVGLALMPWPGAVHRWLGSAARRGGRVIATHAAIGLGGVAVVATVTTAPAWLPRVSVTAADSLPRLSGPVVSGVLVFSVALVGLGALGVLRRRREHQGLEAWALIAGVATCGDVVLVMANEARFDVSWYGARALGLMAALVVLLAMMRSISQLHKQVAADAERLEAQNRELLQAQGLRDHMIAVVSHDMRTPLAGLQGYLELLRDDSDALDPAMIRRMHDRSWLLTRRLTLLTEDLLAVATVENGDLQIIPETVDVAAEAVECATGFPDLEIVLDCPPGLSVVADPLRLQQILTNLVRNAQKHGAAPVTISAATERPGFVEIRVADAGAGVPREFVPRLFERYSRAEERATSGSGLGLSVVHDLVVAHGGTVRYDAVGNAFVIRLAGWSQPATSARSAQPSLAASAVLSS